MTFYRKNFKFSLQARRAVTNSRTLAKIYYGNSTLLHINCPEWYEGITIVHPDPKAKPALDDFWVHKQMKQNVDFAIIKVAK